MENVALIANSTKPIRLNVGGRIFQTAKQTLIACEYFKALFTRWNDNLEDEIFLDRDPDSFQILLTLLRYNDLNALPEMTSDIKTKLIHDASFFGYPLEQEHLQEEKESIPGLKYGEAIVIEGQNGAFLTNYRGEALIQDQLAAVPLVITPLSPDKNGKPVLAGDNFRLATKSGAFLQRGKYNNGFTLTFTKSPTQDIQVITTECDKNEILTAGKMIGLSFGGSYNFFPGSLQNPDSIHRTLLTLGAQGTTPISCSGKWGTNEQVRLNYPKV